MALQIVNPLEIPNWDDLVLATGKASFFHSSAWARVLHESYGYKPIYFCSFENGQLSSLMPFMEVNSWLTGRRGVSLPFTDQCKPIVSDETDFQEMVNEVIDYREKARWRYIEWRDGEYFLEGTKPSEVYCTHDLNLQRDEKELFSRLRGSNRRNIRKAVKSGVVAEIGLSLNSIKKFYRLHCLTRKRHGLPPQPFPFFEKIHEHVVAKNLGLVVSASLGARVIASAVFFHFPKMSIFKYGASDAGYHNYRANNLVMWAAIRWYRERGFTDLNFGRTEPENKGLLQFKRGWGAEESLLKYHGYHLKKRPFQRRLAGGDHLLNKALTCTPIKILGFIGSLLYRHLG